MYIRRNHNQGESKTTLQSSSLLRHELKIKAVNFSTEAPLRHDLNVVSDLPMKGLEMRMSQKINTELGIYSIKLVETTFTSYN